MHWGWWILICIIFIGIFSASVYGLATGAIWSMIGLIIAFFGIIISGLTGINEYNDSKRGYHYNVE